MWYFTADCHFGHANIIKYCKRPFLSKEEIQLCDLIRKGTIHQNELKIKKSTVELMDETILRNINAVVKKNDNLVIAGDFTCNSGSKDIKDYRNRIKCSNVYLIFGNHDERDECKNIFTSCYENYLFKIDGQKIFVSHYPARSWEKANQGSWMLYGHVHNALFNEDHGALSAYERKIYEDGFASVMNRSGIKDDKIIQELIAVVQSTKGIDLTLDVGVDHIREGIPFGTPWSMEDIQSHMSKKQYAWSARKAMYKII